MRDAFNKIKPLEKAMWDKVDAYEKKLKVNLEKRHAKLYQSQKAIEEATAQLQARHATEAQRGAAAATAQATGDHSGTEDGCTLGAVGVDHRPWGCRL